MKLTGYLSVMRGVKENSQAVMDYRTLISMQALSGINRLCL